MQVRRRTIYEDEINRAEVRLLTAAHFEADETPAMKRAGNILTSVAGRVPAEPDLALLTGLADSLHVVLPDAGGGDWAFAHAGRDWCHAPRYRTLAELGHFKPALAWQADESYDEAWRRDAPLYTAVERLSGGVRLSYRRLIVRGPGGLYVLIRTLPGLAVA